MFFDRKNFMISKKLLIIALIFGVLFVPACFAGGKKDAAETSENESAAAPTDALPARPANAEDRGEVYDAENLLSFDIYYPTNPKYEKSPLAVAFHGGGWVSGDKSEIIYTLAPIIKKLRENGYAVATVGYRYAQQSPFPAQLRDAANAVQYMCDNAEKYNIDTNSVGLLGYSAGAQLAMLASYAPVGAGLPLYDREYFFDIKYCVSLAGPSKMYGGELEDYPGGVRYLLEWLFGGQYGEKEAEYISGSPYYYIDARAKKVPLLLVHDEKDDTVPFSQSEAMYKKALEEKIPCELLVLEGFSHQIDFNPFSAVPPSGEGAAASILDFIYKYSGK